MKKLIICILLCGIGYGFVKWNINNTYSHDNIWSYSQRGLAQKYHTFVCDYNIKNIDEGILDSFKKYNYDPILDTLTFYIEKGYKYEPKYLFWTQVTEIPQFILMSPFFNNCQNTYKYDENIGDINYPNIAFRQNANNKYNNIRGNSRHRNKIISIYNNDIPNTIELHVYFSYKRSLSLPPSYLGVITLQKQKTSLFTFDTKLEYYFLFPPLYVPLYCP